MYEAKFSEDSSYEISLKAGEILINGSKSDTEMVRTGDKTWHVIHQGHSMEISVIQVNAEEKTVRLAVNGKKATVSISTEMDKLLKKMGLSAMTSKKATDVKAPMPGLIHSIDVEEGAEVQKGDPLLILEAMKMENVIKAPAEGKVKKIHVVPGASVEKGAVMISFE